MSVWDPIAAIKMVFEKMFRGIIIFIRPSKNHHHWFLGWTDSRKEQGVVNLIHTWIEQKPNPIADCCKEDLLSLHWPVCGLILIVREIRSWPIDNWSLNSLLCPFRLKTRTGIVTRYLIFSYIYLIGRDGGIRKWRNCIEKHLQFKMKKIIASLFSSTT